MVFIIKYFSNFFYSKCLPCEDVYLITLINVLSNMMSMGLANVWIMWILKKVLWKKKTHEVNGWVQSNGFIW